MGILDTIIKFYTSSDKKSGKKDTVANVDETQRIGSLKNHGREDNDPYKEPSNDSSLMPFLEYRAQVVVIKDHLLIGRHGPRMVDVSKAVTINPARECYTVGHERPQIRFLANDQLVIPSGLPSEELIRYSRHHALILYTPHHKDVLHIIDPKSKHGVWINGVRISEFPGSAETLRESPETLEDALKYSKPLHQGDFIHLMDPTQLPNFYLVVHLQGSPKSPIVASTEIEGRSVSFLE